MCVPPARSADKYFSVHVRGVLMGHCWHFVCISFAMLLEAQESIILKNLHCLVGKYFIHIKIFKNGSALIILSIFYVILCTNIHLNFLFLTAVSMVT